MTWGQVGYTRPLPLWEEQDFVFIGMHTSSGYGFAFFCHIVLPELPSTGLQNAVSTVTVVHTVLFLTEELT